VADIVSRGTASLGTSESETLEDSMRRVHIYIVVSFGLVTFV